LPPNARIVLPKIEALVLKVEQYTEQE